MGSFSFRRGLDGLRLVALRPQPRKMYVTPGTANAFRSCKKGLVLQVPGDEAMLLLKPSLLLAGCAAVAVGVVGGWGVLTFSPTRTSSFEEPVQTISSGPLPILQPPADKSSADQPAIA